MTVSNYTDLQTEVVAYSNRNDLSARLPTFIQMAEEEMKRRLKLAQLEGVATVTITAGEGPLPTDYVGARALKWDGNDNLPLTYITPDRFNSLEVAYPNGTPSFYTVVGETLKVLPQVDGSVDMTYQARLTSLSGSNLTNAMITTYPDAYFTGTMHQLYGYTRNDKEEAKWEGKFEKVVQSIILDQKERKYPGPLEVRPR